MHVKKSSSTAERRRLSVDESASDSDVIERKKSHNDKNLSASDKGKKRKNEMSEATTRTFPTRKDKVKRGRQLEGIHAVAPVEPPMDEETEVQILAIETRRLNFEVAKWKRQQALRRETLQLKSEEINLREMTTKERQEVQMMELRARIVQALEESGQSPSEAKKYLALDMPSRV